MQTLTKILIVSAILLTIGVVAWAMQPYNYGTELLIYDQDHWMDKLTPEKLKEYIDKGKISQEEYDNRNQRGDIIEVRKWPKMSTMDPNHWGGHAFRVVVVKGLRYEENKYLMDRMESGRRRYRTSTAAAENKKVAMVNRPTDLTTTENQMTAVPK